MITLNNRKLCENCFSETTVEPCPHCGFIKSAYRHDPITLAVGSVLNQRYMIGGVIGKGGFGITYLAYDLKLDARLAVKEYYPMGLAVRNPGSTLVSVSNEDSEESFKTGAEKFYNEAKMVAKFNGNPNIVSVHDFFYENDTVYFTMGYLQGQTLKSYLKKKKITEGQAINVMQAISSALMASHSLNILHRDISPDNIMLCDDGSIRLLDFGAARQVMAEQSQSLSVILKQGFAPLEQYQKKGKQGPWTDIYALGATIYTALTGDMLNDPMTRLEDDSEFTSNKSGISEALWNVIQKCTQLKIQDRYQDIFELKKDLNSIGIESEAFTDIEVEIRDVLKKGSKPFGSTMGTGTPVPNYAPASDPNATMLLGSDNSDHRTMAMDENATVYLGPDGGGSSNETVAMSPEEAAAYTAGQSRASNTGNAGASAQNGTQQNSWGNTANMPQQPVTGGYMGQPVTGQPINGGYTGQPVTGQPQAGGIPYAAPAQGVTGQPGQAQRMQQNQGGMPYAQPAGGARPMGPQGGPAQGNMTAQYQQRFNQQRQAQAANTGKKGFPVALVVIICVMVLVAIIALAGNFINNKITTADIEATTEASTEAATEDSGEESGEEQSEESSETGGSVSVTGDEAKALDALGVEDIKKYENDTYKYSICYPSGYSVSDADDKTVEIANGDGTLHVAVRYMDRYIDDSILYDAYDFSNMINVRRENLLPVEGSGSTPETDNAGKVDIAGEEDIANFEYHYTDNNDNAWGGNVYLFDSKGQYGCYVVYTLVYGRADDYDELQEYARACADSFKIEGAYDPPEVEIYRFDEYGIKFSVTDGVEAFTQESDGAEDSLHVKYKASSEKNRIAYVMPGEHFGTEYEEIFLGARSCLSSYTIDIVSDMIPIDFGEYRGYWVKALVKDSDGNTNDGRMYVIKTNFGSDAKYQSYVVLGSAEDDDKLREIVGGFRFDGATTYNNADVDTGDTIPFSTSTSGENSSAANKLEYIFPGTDTRELTNSDIDDFLKGYLESNNATNASESERKKICARGLCYARNEIYARHGYIFNSNELKELFGSMSWYTGTIPSDRFNIDVFNSAEKKNVEFLKKKMEDYGGYRPQ